MVLRCPRKSYLPLRRWVPAGLQGRMLRRNDGVQARENETDSLFNDEMV